MDSDSLKIIIDVAQFLLTGGIGVWLWIINSNDVTNQRISKLESETDKRSDAHAERITKLETHKLTTPTSDVINGLAQRVTSLEAHSKNAPTHDDMGDLHERINQMSDGVHTMTGEFGALRRQVETMHNYLLNGGGKR